MTAARRLHAVPRRARAIAIFGGSFDPIHVGHLAVARAAQRRFHLDQIHFVVAGRPPHKTKRAMAAFPHRFAMTALACADHPGFLASLAEAGPDHSGGGTHYSVDTVRHFRERLRHPHDKLYFIIGADAFLEIPMWREYEALLNACDFIVASRPGFKIAAARLVIPPELLARNHRDAHAREQTRPHERQHERKAIALRRTSVHLLDTVASHVSATRIRQQAHRGASIHGLVPARVEEYIHKQALYT